MSFSTRLLESGEEGYHQLIEFISFEVRLRNYLITASSVYLPVVALGDRTFSI